jgi:hypothetical protein
MTAKSRIGPRLSGVRAFAHATAPSISPGHACSRQNATSGYSGHGLSKTITLETNALALRVCLRPQLSATAPKSSRR